MVSKTLLSQIDRFLTDTGVFILFTFYRLMCETETAMGVSLDALSKPNSEYVKAVNV